jgi:uncharacterized protein involved in type VI secretion and phage assembly
MSPTDMNEPYAEVPEPEAGWTEPASPITPGEGQGPRSDEHRRARGAPPVGPPDQRLAGVYPGVVTDNNDPDQLARVRVRVPAIAEARADRDLWARVAVPRAGAQRGTWLIPDIDDEVLVAFEAGDPHRPYVIGSLWNGVDAPPEQMEAGNPVMSIVTAAGSHVTLDDRADQLSVRLETAGGRSVTLRDGDAVIEIDDGSGGSITITQTGVEIKTSGTAKLQASVVEVTAPMINLVSAMTTASGIVKCETLIAENVVASSYTPGAGNVW